MKRQRTTPKKKSHKWRLIILAIVAVVIIAAVSSNDGKNGEASKPAPNDDRTADMVGSTEQPGHGLTYTVLDEAVYDAPVKVMVELYILPAGPISAETLTALLRELYAKTAARTGFRHSRHPTQIFIYAYADRQTWEAGGDLWLAMLYWSEDDEAPDVRVSEGGIRAANARPSTP